MVKPKVLFGSKFWVSRTVRTLKIAVLGTIAMETRRHPSLDPCLTIHSASCVSSFSFDCCMDCSFCMQLLFCMQQMHPFPCLPACHGILSLDPMAHHSFGVMCFLLLVLIVVWTTLFVCNRCILSSSPCLPFICTHLFSCFSILIVVWSHRFKKCK